jgi:hypothetical protein
MQEKMSKELRKRGKDVKREVYIYSVWREKEKKKERRK